MSDESPNRLLEAIQKLKTQPPLTGSRYYAITLLGTEEGKVNHFWQSHIIGMSDDKKSQIREISFVHPLKMLKLWKEIREPGVLINNEIDFFAYYLIGGNGVIEQSLCKRFLPNMVEPREIVRSISQGLMCTDTIPETWLRRAPTKKDRMRILKRDNFRCRLCGRSPHDYVDVELHLHHALPWGRGGLTEDDNLVTLCQTCHKGLDPHYDPEVFAQIGIETQLPKLSTVDDYRRGVVNYRKIATKGYKDLYNSLKEQKGNKSDHN